jgi:hypothetical protein
MSSFFSHASPTRVMLRFVMTHQIRNKHWDKAVSRFLETGAPASAGVILAGRWHSAAGRNGFLLLGGK